jgi:hypothetical protein
MIDTLIADRRKTRYMPSSHIEVKNTQNGIQNSQSAKNRISFAPSKQRLVGLIIRKIRLFD